MPEKPSYFSSTLAQCAVASLGCYLFACLGMVIGGGWIMRNSEVAMTGFQGLRWAAEALVIGYLARAASTPKNGNGEAKPEVKP